MEQSYLEKILVMNVLRKSILSSAIAALDLPKASKGLDAGCGAGLQCLLLAENIGPGGLVTGLDISSEFLEYAHQMAESSNLKDRLSFKKGSIDAIPFKDDSFDWTWSADCVGYGPWEPLPLLKELKRVTKPGGKIAILAWSSENILPGYPLLEARLKASVSGLAPFSKDMMPSRHFHRALGWFAELGIENPKAEVFSKSVHAPLDRDCYKALEALFEMRWNELDKELSDEDMSLYERLCKPDSSDFIIKHRDYYAFFTYSMFSGTVIE